MRTWPERLLFLTRRHATAAVFFGSFVAAVAIFAGPAVVDLAHHCLPGCLVDAHIYPWSYRWMLEAVTSGEDPLRTSFIGAPGGLSLTWVTTVMAPAFFMAPVTALLGAYPSVALTKLLSVALSTTAAYALCREVTGRHLPAVIGGFLFGFGSYTTVRIMHLNLLVVFPIPLIVLQTIRLQRGIISRRRYGVTVGALLTFQFYTSTEVFASAVLFGGLAWVLHWWGSTPSDRRAIESLIPATIGSVVLTTLLASPFLVRAFGDRPASVAHDLERRSAVLADYLVPSELHLLGKTFAEDRASLGYVPGPEGAPRTAREAYLGPVLLLLLVRGRGSLRRASFPFRTFCAVVVLLSLGPVMRLTPGGPGIPGPGWIVEQIPLVGLAFPNRFPLYLWLAIAVYAAIALAERSQIFTGRAVLAGLVCAVSIAPGPLAAAPLPALSSAESPAAFSDGTLSWFVAPEDVVLARGVTQQSLRWQVESGMKFRMMDAFLGPYTPWRATMPLYPTEVPDAAPLVASLTQGDVRWVMFAGSETLPWARLLGGLTRWPAVRYEGLVLWDVSAISGIAATPEPPSLEAQALLRHARSYEAEGLFTKAADMYRGVLEVRPRNRWAHYGLGKVYERYGDEERAALHYQAAVAENPRYVAALLSLARIWRSVGFEAGAFVAYERVAGLRPDLLDADERLFLQAGPGEDG